ncbi:MAG: hypothetical protein Q9223_005274 [Gallowayella weberi]
MHPLLALFIYCLLIPITSARSLGLDFRPNLYPDCWEHADNPNFRPLVFRDCLSIIRNDVTRGREANLPLTFSRSRSAKPDIKLPAYWMRRDNNKCMVAVDAANDEVSYDTTTLSDVERAAESVARDCVIGDPHLGGMLRVGWKNNLRIMIAAVPPKKNGTGILESE